MARREHYVVFGASDTADKAVIAGKSKPFLPGGYAVMITDLQGTHNFGDENFPLDDMTGVYTTLHFCKRESLDAFIRALERLRNMWDENESESVVEWDNREICKEIEDKLGLNPVKWTRKGNIAFPERA